ncbi:MAG: TIGR03915 family putative DNA repair protein [Clostridia bacterium]|nr:TIGR03915 family putative DNA repair protein [Clostridia bacterium]
MTFIYDGSFEGFLTSVFDGYLLKNHCEEILPAGKESPLFSDLQQVETDGEKANRVEAALKKYSPRAWEMVFHAWLSHLPGIEDRLLHFIRLCFSGIDAPSVMQHSDVQAVFEAARAVSKQAALYMGILRFSLIQGIYTADMKADYDLLPLLGGHFSRRFGEDPFLIRDRRFNRALLGRKGRWCIVDARELTEAPTAPVDDFERMWVSYFHAMAIRERVTASSARAHVPQKHWKYLTERRFSDQK